MSEHPSREELSALVRGDLPDGQADAILLHLLEGCETCLAQAPPEVHAFLGPEPTAAQEEEYEAALDRAFGRALRAERHLRREREAAARAETLLASGGLEALERLPRRMGWLARMEALLARSWAVRHESPALMIQAATAAVWCAGRLSARRYGARQVADFQCRARAELGNAWRVGQQFSTAAAELAHARHLFELGTGDEFLEVRLVELEASLAADLRQFALACNNLLKVHEFYAREGDDHRAGRALIKRGLYTGYAGDPQEGFRLLGEGLARIDEDRDPGLAHAAVHNQLLFLIDSGQFQEARKFRLKESRRLARKHGRVNAIKIRALEGRNDAGLGKHARAEGILREVQRDYEEVGRAGEAAITRLDLAASLLALGKAGEARELVEEAAKLFFALEIEREALMAVLMLRHAFEREMATVALVQEVAAFVRRAQNDPNARFEPERW